MKRNVCLFAFVMFGVLIFFGCSEQKQEKVISIKPAQKPAKKDSASTSCPTEKAPAEKAPEVKVTTEKKEPAKEVTPAEAKPEMPKMPPMQGGMKLKEFLNSLELPEVVATVGKDKITKEDVFKEIESQIPKFMHENPLPPQAIAQLKSNLNLIVDSMISRQLLVELAAKDGIKPSPEMIVAKFNEFVKSLPPEKKKMFEAQLQASGSSIEKRRKEASEDVNSQAAMAIDQWITEKIIPEIKVDDKAVEKYYRENQEQFKKPETIKVAHILITPEKGTAELADKTPEEKKAFAENAEIKAKKEAESILAKLKQGGDFATIAKEKSACPSKRDGGMLPEFDKNGVSPGSQGAMDATFTAASYKLKPGGISDVVKTPFGYHIIKCVDKNKESYIPLAKVKDYLKKSLEKEQIGKKVKTLVDSEKEKQKVVIHLKDKTGAEEK